MGQLPVVNHSHQNHGPSHTNEALGENTPLLGKEAEALISCNQKLQELGINNTIRLPQICVIGDQSTGKSSLIEALSTIQVPKAKGCCAQCPLAINLSSGQTPTSPWTCVVSIEERYYFDESLLPLGVTKNNKFGPWQERTEMRVTQVKTTTDKEEVTHLIRAAQYAILNPGTSAKDFLSAENKFVSNSARPVNFSPNIIRLDVSEGRWPNLSFIDLPGVIVNTAQEKDKYLVTLIQNLVRQYASTESSVNMLTLPMTHDVENSQACAIIQSLKVQERTLAVFTKADLADDDQRKLLLNRFLEGKEGALGFEQGYHFVVMPETDPDEARAEERIVFTQKPWSELDARFQDRLGVDALRIYLRRLLFHNTKAALPGNLNNVRVRLDTVDRELLALPEPPNAVLLSLQLEQCVTRFENTMKTLFSGEPESTKTSARALWPQAISRFKHMVTRAKPTILLLTRAESDRLKRAEAALADDVVEISENETARSPTIKQESPTKKDADPKHRFRLEDVCRLNERFYQSCIPGEIELRAVEEMNKLSVQHWDRLLHGFMASNSTLLHKQILTEVDHAFGHYRHLDLFSVVQSHVKEYVDTVVQKEWDIAEEICHLERTKPLSYDIERLREKEKICLEDWTTKRQEQRARLAKAELAVSGGTLSRKKDAHLDLLGPDPYENELRMSAQNRAYYEVAMIRFVDCISLGIMGRLLPSCTEKLVESLKEHLGLNDHTKHDQIIQWMAEDSAPEHRRRALLHEKQQLTEGLAYIEEVLGKSKPLQESPKRRHSAQDGGTVDGLKTPSKRAKRNQADSKAQPTHLTLLNSPLTKRVQNIELED